MSHSFPQFPNLTPVCPVDALPDVLRDAVLHAISKKDIPAGVALTDAIAAIAAVVHCAYDAVTPDGERMPTTINTCSTADSASGKGRSIKLFFKHALEARKRPPPVSKGIALPIPWSRRLPSHMMSKPSFRALMEALDGRGMNLTVQREEGSSFLKTDLFKKDTDALAQVWSGDPPLDHVVYGAHLEAIDARCSLGFRIQPAKMDEYLKGPGRGSYQLGFWPRTLACCHDPEKFPANETYRFWGHGTYTTREFDVRMLRLSSSVTSFVQTAYKGRHAVELNNDAKAFMLELGYRMKQWRKAYYGDIREAAGRAWENTLRVAVVLHVFCIGEGKVTRDYVERAWAIVEWSLAQHRLIFVESPRLALGTALAMKAVPVRLVRVAQPKLPKPPRPLQKAQWFLECIAKQLQRQPAVTVREVNQLAGLSPKDLEAALKWLELEGAVRLKPLGRETLIELVVWGPTLGSLGH
jgi:hypothetical protein